MTELERWINQAPAIKALLEQLLADEASEDERNKACKEEFGFGLRVAQQRLKVASILDDRKITAAQVGDLDPSKLRSLGKKTLPDDREQALDMIRGLKSQTNQQLNDQRRKEDAPALRMALAAWVMPGDKCFAVALAAERQRGQLMLILDETCKSIEEVAAFVRGASWPVGGAWIVADGLSTGACKDLERRTAIPKRWVAVRRASDGRLPLTASQRKKAFALLRDRTSARRPGGTSDSDLAEAAFSKMGWRPRTDLKERPLAARAALVLALSRWAPETLRAK